MALLERIENKGRIGTKEVGFDFKYRALTVEEYSRLKTAALWEEGNPVKIDFVELARISVSSIDNFPEPYQGIKTIDALLDLSINTDDENASFIAEAAWAMGWKIWTEINGVNKKKSSPDSSPESMSTNSPGRRRLSRLFQALHRK
jgi:hypothetical protein